MNKDYIYFDSTVSLCPVCLSRIDAKIIMKSDKVFMIKKCRKHGEFKTLLEEDAEYFVSQALYKKPGTVSKLQTKISKGCPYDCGLCPDHEQHSCIGLINITDSCDLGCSFCYNSSSNDDHYLSLKQIEKMIDFFTASEFSRPEILQVSGGEPANHPDLFKILKMIKASKIRYMMLNTNGIRIAEDEKFAEELSQFKENFEIYLQFDSLSGRTCKKLRGRDLLSQKLKTVKNLTKYEIPVTLVASVENGINDSEIGRLIDFGLKTKFVRGVNFQPVAYFGRVARSFPENRMTLTGIIKRMEKQTKGLIKKSDMIPLPCDPHRISLTYLINEKNKYLPLTRSIDIKKYLSFINNSFYLKPQSILRNSVKQIFSLSNPWTCFSSIKDTLCFIPKNPKLLIKNQRLDFVNENIFRISIVSFLDKFNFDLRSIKSECVHIITKDLKKIPFSVYNIFRGSVSKF
jgi:uncharacterized radical SAM superfamily Fe-S cluster-containing enzyme